MKPGCASCWPERASSEDFEQVFDLYETNFTDQTGPLEGWATCMHCRAQYGFSCLLGHADRGWEYVLVPTQVTEQPSERLREMSLSDLFKKAREEQEPWVYAHHDLSTKGAPRSTIEVRSAPLPTLSWELSSR
jgi:hypothetical protein